MDSPENAEDQSKQSQETGFRLSRRNLLKGGAALVATAIAGRVIGNNPTATIPEPTGPTREPRPTRNVDERNRYDLQTTATAVAKHDKDNSFVPEHGFTEEMFNRVRRGVYVLEYFPEPHATRGVRGTGSIIDISEDGKTVVFITAQHVAHPDAALPSLGHTTPPDQIPAKLFIPNKKGEKISPIAPPRAKIIKGGQGILGYDLALVEMTLHEPLQNASVLPFQDDPQLHKGEQLWTLGYPIDFQQNGTDSTEYILSSNYIELSEIDPVKKTIGGPAISGRGASGSPIMALINGVPTIVGIFSETNVEHLPGPTPAAPGTPTPNTVMGRSFMDGHSLTQIHDSLDELKRTRTVVHELAKAT